MSWECLIVPKKKDGHKWIETDFPTFCPSSNNHGLVEQNESLTQPKRDSRPLRGRLGHAGVLFALKAMAIGVPPFSNPEIHEIRWIFVPEVPVDTLASQVPSKKVNSTKKIPKLTRRDSERFKYMESYPPVAKKDEYEKKSCFNLTVQPFKNVAIFSWPPLLKVTPTISSRTRCFWDVVRWPAFWVTRWVPSLLRRRREGLLRVGWFSCILDQGEFIKREFPKVKKKGEKNPRSQGKMCRSWTINKK